MSLSSTGEGAAYWLISLLNRECEKLQKKTEDAAVAAEKKDEKKRKAVENAAKKADASKAAK